MRLAALQHVESSWTSIQLLSPTLQADFQTLACQGRLHIWFSMVLMLQHDSTKNDPLVHDPRAKNARIVRTFLASLGPVLITAADTPWKCHRW